MRLIPQAKKQAKKFKEYFKEVINVFQGCVRRFQESLKKIEVGFMGA